jgi:hypothetical protein
MPRFISQPSFLVPEQFAKMHLATVASRKEGNLLNGYSLPKHFANRYISLQRRFATKAFRYKRILIKMHFPTHEFPDK